MPFPMPLFLKGEHLELRPIRSDDFEPLYHVASDPLIWEQHPENTRYQREVFERFFQGAIESGWAFVVIDRRTSSLIGSSRYHDYDEVQSQIEIGWTFLARSHWGGKYNGELKSLMLEHAFLFVDQVVFVVGENNLRSQRAVIKIGGDPVGKRLNPAGGESVVFRLTKSKWRSRDPKSIPVNLSNDVPPSIG